MSYSFSQNDMQSFYTQDKIDFILPKNKGKMYTQRHYINEDVLIFKNSMQTNDDICIKAEPFFDNIVYITYILKGGTKVKYHDCEKALYYKQQEASLQVVKLTSCEYELLDREFQSLSIVLSSNFMQKHLSQFRDIKHTKQIKSNAINPKIQSLINEIYTSPYEGLLNDLYIQSKTLEIVFLEIANLEENQVLPKVKFNDFDIQAIKKAKEYLIQNYANPPSIKELSRIVRLNEFKLKYGFKIHFNITPYQFVLNYRLKQAKVMLESGELNVSEIAQITGYKHVQNFSNAFCKHFGMTPKSLNKNKTFYF